MRYVGGKPQADFQKARIDQWAHEAAEDAFIAIRPLLTAAHCSITEHVCISAPAPRIVDVARSCRADAIVMGTLGPGAFLSAILGSVATRVLASSSVPVVLMPTHDGLGT
ncbi:universal stress protein [Ralstonia pseudosolanacearum]|uniref:universal stress protein n=1 Tax=Ralstonia pseudosolanacearum TaxID=1310165 RepID=UPI003CEA611A